MLVLPFFVIHLAQSVHFGCTPIRQKITNIINEVQTLLETLQKKYQAIIKDHDGNAGKHKQDWAKAHLEGVEEMLGGSNKTHALVK